MTGRTVVLCTLALALVACSGQSGADASGDTEEVSSVAEFLGFGVVEDDSDRERRAQEAIRVCMAEAGFKYRPVDYSQTSAVVEWDEEEWARAWGFAITTTYGRWAEQRQRNMAMEQPDPNREIVEALSEEERDAWHEALVGIPAEQSSLDAGPDNGEETFVIEGGWGSGCQGEAYRAEFGDASASSNVWEALAPDLDALYDRVKADPRIVALDTKWAGCMAEAGYDYSSPEDMTRRITDDLYPRLEEIVGPHGWPDAFAGWNNNDIDRFYRDATSQEVDELLLEAEEAALMNVDMEAVARLQQEETDLAVADYECRSNYRTIYQEVTAEYEREYILKNRTHLEQLRDSIGS